MNRGIGKHREGARALAIATTLAMLTVMTMAPTSAFASGATEKEETVYVVTDTDGSQNDVIVSDHLSNKSQLDVIKDKTDLKNIENVKGDEKFTAGDGNSISWKAGGNDIYYQGTTTRELPVTMNVKYTLDGKSIEAGKLDGKSGRLKIKIDYKNNTNVNGSKVPFVVLSGFLVKDNCLTNIDIDHGKVIDDGEKQVVVGMVAPGLAEDLDVDADKIGLSDSVTIEGQAKDFSVQDIMTIATNSVFENIDTSELNLDFDDEINQLNEGSKKLVEGSSALYKGLEKLDSSVPKLRNGVKKLSEGSHAIKQGMDKLNSNLNKSLSDLLAGTKGAKEGSSKIYQGIVAIKYGLDNHSTNTPGLENVLGRIVSGMTGLNEKAAGVIDTANNCIRDAGNDARSEEGNLTSASAELASASANASAAKNDIDKAKLSISSAVEKINNNENLTENEKSDMKTVLQEAGNNLDTAKGRISDVGQAKEDVDQAKDLNRKVIAKLDGAEQYTSGLKSSLSEQLTTAGSGDNAGKTLCYAVRSAGEINRAILKTLGDDKSDGTLIKGAYDLSTGLGNMETSVADATSSGGDLAQGLKKLSGGSKKLADGLDELYDKSGNLVTGVSKLDKGSMELSRGMSKLYQDGIKKIVDLYHGDLKGLTDGLDTMVNAGKEYRTFTLLPSSMKGSVKFVYKTPVTE